MLFYTVGQSNIFLWMVLAGILSGAWYDGLDRLRRGMQAGWLLSLALDLLFGAGLGALLIAAFWMANGLELRLYALLGAACGFVLFMGGCSPLIDRMVRAIVSILRAPLRIRWVRALVARVMR